MQKQPLSTSSTKAQASFSGQLVEIPRAQFSAGSPVSGQIVTSTHSPVN
jgi:hypothetical protein